MQSRLQTTPYTGQVVQRSPATRVPWRRRQAVVASPAPLDTTCSPNDTTQVGSQNSSRKRPTVPLRGTRHLQRRLRLSDLGTAEQLMQALNSGIAKYESDSNSIPGGRSSTHSRSKQRIAPRQAPSLPRPWKELGDDDRRAYLVAVRDHYGEGVLCERVLRSGRKVVALLDPRMAPRWEAHAWRDERRGGGGLYAEAAGLQGGRAHLAEWTGRECVLGGSAAMSVKAWQHKDGCPANCLPRNLELELVAGGRDEAAMLRMAQISARGALQHLYSVMGPRQGRRYLAALHSEYCGAPHS